MSDAISKTKVLECIGNAINKIVNMPTTHDNARKTHGCDNERTETHDCDLISRQDAIDALTHKWDGMVTSVFDVLKELPSAEPERAQFGPDCHLVWQYCRDPNDVMKAVMEKDENWEGLDSPEQIISIVYDSNHKSYVVFWIAKWQGSRND